MMSSDRACAVGGGHGKQRAALGQEQARQASKGRRWLRHVVAQDAAW